MQPTKLVRVLRRDYQGQNCSIARTLEILGERWTLLIVRDAFLGVRRFDAFGRKLGVAPNILSRRLETLASSHTSANSGSVVRWA